MALQTLPILRWHILYPSSDTFATSPPSPATYYCHHPFGVFYLSALIIFLLGKHDVVVHLPAILMSIAIPPLLFSIGKKHWGAIAGAATACGLRGGSHSDRIRELSQSGNDMHLRDPAVLLGPVSPPDCCEHGRPPLRLLGRLDRLCPDCTHPRLGFSESVRLSTSMDAALRLQLVRSLVGHLRRHRCGLLAPLARALLQGRQNRRLDRVGGAAGRRSRRASADGARSSQGLDRL